MGKLLRAAALIATALVVMGTSPPLGPEANDLEFTFDLHTREHALHAITRVGSVQKEHAVSLMQLRFTRVGPARSVWDEPPESSFVLAAGPTRPTADAIERAVDEFYEEGDEVEGLGRIIVDTDTRRWSGIAADLGTPPFFISLVRRGEARVTVQAIIRHCGIDDDCGDLLIEDVTGDGQ